MQNEVRLWQHLLFVFILSLSFAGRAQSASPVYLSFEQRWVISYMLLGVGESPDIQKKIVDRFSRQVKSVLSQKPQIVKVHSFDEFLKYYRGNWPNSYSVKSDVELLEKEGVRPIPFYETDDVNLQEQINQFILNRNKFISTHLSEQISDEMLREFQALSNSDIKKIYKNLRFPSPREILVNNFKNARTVSRDLFQAMGVPSDSFQEVMKLVIQEYFQQLGLESQKQILNVLLGEDLNSTSIEKFEAMVMNSGPIFQKLLQIIAREKTFDSSMNAVFKKMESKVRPVNEILLHNIIDPEINNYSILRYDSKPLAVGTMAQVQQGYVQNKKLLHVVIRFLKPGIRERVEEDAQILTRMAPIIDSNANVKNLGFPKLSPIVSDLIQNVRDELELKNTVERQVEGKRGYDQTVMTKLNSGQDLEIVIHVPDVILSKDPKTQLLVQSFAGGQSLEEAALKWQDEIPDLKKIVAESISSVWLTELLINKGFYHADLHQGNFKINMSEIEKNKIKISILDFGMGGKISLAQRRSLLLVGAGTEIYDAKMVTEALWNLAEASRSGANKATFAKSVVEKIINIQHSGTNMSVDSWVIWAMEHGLSFSPETLGMSRGFVILDRLLAQSGSDLNMLALGKKIVMQNKLSVALDLRETGHVDYLDLMKMWMASFKQPKKPILFCREVLL